MEKYGRKSELELKVYNEVKIYVFGFNRQTVSYIKNNMMHAFV